MKETSPQPGNIYRPIIYTASDNNPTADGIGSRTDRHKSACGYDGTGTYNMIGKLQ